MNGNQGRSQFAKCLTCLLQALFLISYPLTLTNAENLGDLARARFANKTRTGSLASVEYAGLRLDGGSELTVVSPHAWRQDANSLMSALEETHRRYSALFGPIPKISLTVRLMEEETFYLSTGAPSWTNAMFFKGQIVIPVPKQGRLDQENLVRSIRHEYTHAVVHALTNGECQGWLDEGLAQWAEGEINPLLTQSLSEWLVDNQPVPLKLLQGGFTKLPTPMVPPAYAQSLLSTKYLLERHGVASFSKFFSLLRAGLAKDVAFKKAFGRSEIQFERDLAVVLPGLLRQKQFLTKRATDLTL